MYSSASPCQPSSVHGPRRNAGEGHSSSGFYWEQRGFRTAGGGCVARGKRARRWSEPDRVEQGGYGPRTLQRVQDLALFLEGRDAENPFAVGLWLLAGGCRDTGVTQCDAAGDKMSSHFYYNIYLGGIKHLRSTWTQRGVIQIAPVTYFFILTQF